MPDYEERFPINSRHRGKVKALIEDGVMVQLAEGIVGIVHLTDLSWTKRYEHPSEFTKVGYDLDVVILAVDNSNGKISLGHKQTEEDPWDTFERVFPVDSYHEVTILHYDNSGAKVLLPYGLEAFAPIYHIRKMNGKLPEIDEVLACKVISIDREEMTITVSHIRYLQDVSRRFDF